MRTTTRKLAMYLLAFAFALQGFTAIAQRGEMGAAASVSHHHMAASAASAHAGSMHEAAVAMSHTCHGAVDMQVSDVDNSEHSTCCHHYTCNASSSIIITPPVYLPYFVGRQALPGSAKRLHNDFYTGALERPPRTLLV